MKYIFILLMLDASFIVCGQQLSNSNEIKYVIFTTDKKAEETDEGIYKYTSEVKSETLISFPIVFRCVSKERGIEGAAYHFEYDFEKLAKYRKVTERDSLVIKEEPYKFLNSVELIDIDVLFPKMTKEEFIKFWNNLRGISPEGNVVYFIDRAEIKDRKVKLYPAKVVGINLY